MKYNGICVVAVLYVEKVAWIVRMAAAFHQAICGNQLHGYNDSLSSCDELRNFAMMPRFSCFGTSKTPLNKAKCRYNHSKVFVVRASVSDSIVSSLDSSDHDSWKMTGK